MLTHKIQYQKAWSAGVYMISDSLTGDRFFGKSNLAHYIFTEQGSEPKKPVRCVE